MSLTLRIRSVTSSFTPGMTSNSWSASSKCTCVTAAPGIDERSVRRRLLPRVCPKPGSSGPIVNCWRLPSGSPASTWGRWMISMVHRLGSDERVVARLQRATGAGVLLGVELDDELLAHGDVDLLPQRQVSHGDLEVGRRSVEPHRDGTVDRVDVV